MGLSFRSIRPRAFRPLVDGPPDGMHPLMHGQHGDAQIDIKHLGGDHTKQVVVAETKPLLTVFPAIGTEHGESGISSPIVMPSNRSSKPDASYGSFGCGDS